MGRSMHCSDAGCKARVVERVAHMSPAAAAAAAAASAACCGERSSCPTQPDAGTAQPGL